MTSGDSSGPARAAKAVGFESRARAALSLASAVPLLAALALGVLSVRGKVREAEDDLLRAEAATAVELLAETGSEEPLDRLFGERWRRVAATDELLDRPVLVRASGRRLARAALYGTDRWTPVGTLELVGRGDARARLPPGVLLLALAAAALLGALAVTWPVAAADGKTRWTAGPALLALLVLALPFQAAGRWADARLGEVTSARLGLAAAALDALPDAPALVARPGGVAQLTGLAFTVRGAPRTGEGTAAFSTLLPATSRALEALPSPPPERARVDAVPWALAERESVVLARVPYEHTGTPWPFLIGIALAGAALALLPALLAPAAGERRRLRRNVVAWAFLAPAGAHLALFTLGPLAFALWLSLHRWNLVDVARPFVGLANYAALLRDGAFWNAIRNTAVFTLHVPVAMALALAFALLVHRRTRGVVWVRAALFLPTITSLVAIAVVWQWMLNDQYGLLNWILAQVGLGPVRWLTSPRTALLSVMLLSTWIVVGYQMVLFQAGLAAIPSELYDAARIDGAGRWQRFRHVTLPGLRHTLFFVLVTSVIGSFQVFGAVYVMTEGGPLRSTDVAVYHIYEEGWEYLRFGSAAAMSWVLFVIVFAVTWLHFRVLERRTVEG